MHHKFTVQQNAGSVTPPVGFTNYLGVTSSSAYSVTASDYFHIEQDIEGFNVADLGLGTANAKTITLSFWVYSSLTGTFGGVFKMLVVADIDIHLVTRFLLLILGNTKSVTIAGDTSGTWLTTNGIGNLFDSVLAAGSTYERNCWCMVKRQLYLSATGATSVVGTNGATFYITGVQLEVGSTATSFDYLDHGTAVLQLCQTVLFHKKDRVLVAT